MFGFLKRKPRTVANLKVGKPDVTPDKPSHVRGVREGNNQKGKFRKEGLVAVGRFTAKAFANRSTGIRPKAHGPIDPRMPHLPPS